MGWQNANTALWWRLRGCQARLGCLQVPTEGCQHSPGIGRRPLGQRAKGVAAGAAQPAPWLGQAALLRAEPDGLAGQTSDWD